MPAPGTLAPLTMTNSFHIRRKAPRSLAQISLDPGGENSIAGQLRDSRRLARAIAPALRGLPLGVDFSQISNIRLRDGKIILFVRSALQKSKLRQVLPRISELAARAGYLQSIDIVIRPTATELELRRSQAAGAPRELSEKSAAAIEAASRSMEDSPLKDALAELAAARRARTPSQS